jgi:hypothetical protein
MADYGPLPGYTDTSYQDGQQLHQASTATTANAGVAPESVLRVAAAIIIGSLILLWVFGGLVFKGGK